MNNCLVDIHVSAPVFGVSMAHNFNMSQLEVVIPSVAHLSLEQRILRLRHIGKMRIVAIGDSSVFGVGDFDDQSHSVGAGWTGRFAHDLKAGRFVNLGKNGARFRSVVKKQLGGAISMRPDLALICVGTNDVLRGDFSPAEIRAAVESIITQFNQVDAVPVFLGIPDPIQTAPGPMSLKKILHTRVKLVNAIIEQVAEAHCAAFVSTWNHSMASDRSMWHIDRMHPSAKGHQEISDLVRRSLFLPRRSRKKLPVGIEGESKKDQIFWLLTNGAKWFAKRSIDLVPALIWLVVSNSVRRHKFSADHLEA